MKFKRLIINKILLQRECLGLLVYVILQISLISKQSLSWNNLTFSHQYLHYVFYQWQVSQVWEDIFQIL